MNKKGYIQVYTGNGKGKTTAAAGLALRASAAGYRVYFGQFIKGMAYNEFRALKGISNIEIELLGSGCFIFSQPSEDDRKAARESLEKIKGIISSGKYDLVVLDELNIAVYFNLISSSEVVEIMKNKPDNLELIITGRYATDDIIENADLVTEMKEIKHYYQKGISARDGIER